MYYIHILRESVFQLHLIYFATQTCKYIINKQIEKLEDNYNILVYHSTKNIHYLLIMSTSYLLRNHTPLTVFLNLWRRFEKCYHRKLSNTVVKVLHEFSNEAMLIITLKRLTLSIFTENKKSLIVFSFTSSVHRKKIMFI